MSKIFHTIPDQIRGNHISKLLDDLLRSYMGFVREGRIFGLVLVDQDAKVIAVNTFFDTKYNYWDMGAIGAALHGVAKQGRDFFQSQAIERASIIFQNNQLFVHMIGEVKLGENQTRELLLLVLGEKLNIGLIIMLMQRNANKIKTLVESDQKSQRTMLMSEQEFQNHINQIKRELFQLG